MTFATVESITPYSAGFLTSHNFPYPATINSGDLLLSMFKYHSGSVTNLDVGDFTTLLNTTYDDGSPRRIWVGGKIATGSESGFNTVSQSESRAAVEFMFRISNWSGNLNDINFSTPVGGSGVSPNAGPVTAPWGADDNLFIWFGVWQDDGETISAYPSGYVDNQLYEDNGLGIDLSVSGAVATLESTSASSDPGPATISGSEAWGALTIVVRSATSGAGPDPFFVPALFPIAQKRSTLLRMHEKANAQHY